MRVSSRPRAWLFVIVVVAVVVGVVAWLRHDSGYHWDDADVGQCVHNVPQLALSSMLGHAARTATLECADPSANYVVVSRSPTATDLLRWTAGCPDPASDAVGTGHVRFVPLTHRSAGRATDFGLMCLAPVLHVEQCYLTDRALGVRPDTQCLPGARRVTRSLPNVSDLQRCSPAIGLVLTRPRITYCEVTVPMPS